MDLQDREWPFLFAFCTPLAILCVTVLVFFPVLENGFVNWDDEMNFLENPHYRGLGWAQLQWMWTTFHGSNYRPLAWITSGLDYVIWETEAFGYHLTSLLLHGVNGILFYFLAGRLLELTGHKSSRVAFVAALFFSIHPLRVEVVAWASARNDLVASFFCLCTLLAYLRYATSTRKSAQRRWFGLTTALYSCSLLSKATALALPLIFLVLDVYPLRRLGGGINEWFQRSAWHVWFEKLPFIVLASIAGAVAIRAKESTAAVLGWDSYGWAPRLGQACYGLFFYLAKTILPVGLSPLYQLTPQFAEQKLRFVLFAIGIAAVTLGFYLARRKSQAALAGWLCYAALLSPVLGIVQSGPQITADRYSYLACMPWALLLAARLLGLGQRAGSIQSKLRTTVMPIFSMLIIVVFGILSWQQTEHWKNSATLWQRVLDIDPDSTIAHNNLGNYLVDLGRFEEAKQHYLTATAIEPSYAQAHVNLGMVLSWQGNLEESTAHIRTALQNDPSNWQGYHALGTNFAIAGVWEQAAEQFRRALHWAPNQSGIHVDLARVLARQGKIDEAVQHLEEAIRIRPDSPQAHRELASLTASKRKTKQ